MLTDLPRYLGFPKQIYITNKFAFRNLINKANGKVPCYTTQYQYPTRNTLIVDKVLFEMDCKKTRQIPYTDIRKLKSFSHSTSNRYRIIFSGRKGFHFYIGFEPIHVKNDHDKIILKNKILSIQLALEQHLNLQSLDHNTIGKLRLPIRIPTTKYVSNKKKSNGFYCRYIPPSQFNKGLDHIEELAHSPGVMPKPMNPSKTINQLIDDIPSFTLEERFNEEPFIPELFRHCEHTPSTQVLTPCMKHALTSRRPPHPPHPIRIEITTWLKFIGYNDNAIINFFRVINWQDFNLTKTSANVKTIKTRHPSCNTLRYYYGDSFCKNCILSR